MPSSFAAVPQKDGDVVVAEAVLRQQPNAPPRGEEPVPTSTISMLKTISLHPSIKAGHVR
jgi:hypothetical protein